MTLLSSPVFDVPKHSSAKVDVVFHEPHAGISWPTLLVAIADNVLIVGVGVLCEVSLDEISSLLCSEPEGHNTNNTFSNLKTQQMLHSAAD